jgi:hypothetical protein
MIDLINRKSLEVEPEEEADTVEKGPYILQSEGEKASAFFLRGSRCMLTPRNFVNLTGGGKNFKMLELRVPLNIKKKKHCERLLRK